MPQTKGAGRRTAGRLRQNARPCLGRRNARRQSRKIRRGGKRSARTWARRRVILCAASGSSAAACSLSWRRGSGLFTDLAVFTALIAHGQNPLAARAVSLVIATLVTWRLNRALTFDRSGRRPADEAMRYAMVAAAAQAVSYAVFAALVVTVLSAIPQLAVLFGAASGALVSYSGQALFAFRPRRSRLSAPGHDRRCRSVRDRRRAGRADRSLLSHQERAARSSSSSAIRPMSAASAAPLTTRAFCSTSAATASSPNRRRLSRSGRNSCPTISSTGRACRASITTANSSPIRSRRSKRSLKLGVFTSAACLMSYIYARSLPGRRRAHVP